MRIRIFLAVVFACLIANPMNADEAEYRLTFTGGWTLKPLPGNAHFSPLVGATHAEADAIFAAGGLASPGVENVAELGTTGVIVSEINSGVADGSLGSLILRPGNVGPAQTVIVDFVATPEYSLVTMLSMIAPSPDWFVGLHDFDLRPDGVWLDEVTLELNSYDAGTENGSTFSLSNPATVPQSFILPLDDVEPDGPLTGFGSVATVTLIRTDVDLFVPGDVNNDGEVNPLDVNPFVALIAEQIFIPAADINCDGEVNLLDVQPFVNLLNDN